MAYFAQLDENNIVINVIKVDESDCSINGVEDEAVGISFCNSLIPGTWLQTSYNSRIRKNYAGIGFKYDADMDAFIPPKIFESWILDKDTCTWVSPVPRPENGLWEWEEETLSWKSIEKQEDMG